MRKPILFGFLTLLLFVFLAAPLPAKAADIKPPVFPKDPVTGRYNLADYDRFMKESQAAITASRAKPDYPRWQMALAKMNPLAMLGSGIYAARQGLLQKTDSPFEWLLALRVCRMANTFKNQCVNIGVGGVMELVTPESMAQYAPEPGQLGMLAERTIKRGPVTQMLKTTMCAVPPALLATGAMEGLDGVSQAGSIAITSATGGVVGVGIVEAVDYLEKALTNAMFKTK